MLGRVLTLTFAAAWIATAAPARAYDSADASEPPPDDPAAWTQQEATARIAGNLKRCDMMFSYDASGLTPDDPSAYAAARGLECSCDRTACAGPRGAPGTEDDRAHAAADSPG